MLLGRDRGYIWAHRDVSGFEFSNVLKDEFSREILVLFSTFDQFDPKKNSRDSSQFLRLNLFANKSRLVIGILDTMMRLTA